MSSLKRRTLIWGGAGLLAAAAGAAVRLQPLRQLVRGWGEHVGKFCSQAMQASFSLLLVIAIAELDAMHWLHRAYTELQEKRAWYLFC